MSKSDKKPSFLKKLFAPSKHNKENVDGRRREQHGVTFNNDVTRYYEREPGRKNQNFIPEEDDLRDKNGYLKPTAPYHTSTRTKARPGPRSCPGVARDNEPQNYSSDSEDTLHNRSFQSEFITNNNKRQSRRTSVGKRPKRLNRSIFTDYDDQDSVTLGPLRQINGGPPGTSRRAWQRAYEEDWVYDRDESLRKKYAESQEKIRNVVGKYRRAKAEIDRLHGVIQELTVKSREDARMIHVSFYL
jgi:hypothetical protein